MKFEYGNIERNDSAYKTVVLASGKSLSDFDMWSLNRPDIFVIAVNDSVKFAPFADAWFTIDPWGLGGKQLPGDKFNGKLYAGVPEDFGDPLAKCRDHRVNPPDNITYLKRVHMKGLSEKSDSIRTGNSGFGAFNMAYLMGAKNILLLGVDATRGYFYNNLKITRSLNHLPQMFEDSLPQLKSRGVKVINGSPQSKVYSFTRYEPDYALELFLND
jgi:hypothetical protein